MKTTVSKEVSKEDIKKMNKFLKEYYIDEKVGVVFTSKFPFIKKIEVLEVRKRV